MIKTKNKVKYIYAVLLIVLSLGVFLQTFPATAFADVSKDSDVLEDLKSDESFDVGLYPMNSRDYSINLIQIAESADKKLYVYVYQPSAKVKKLTATSINIAESEELSFKNYKLTLINTNGVFQKYVVDDFAVKDYKVRYYYISSIFRAWDELLDDGAGHDNTITEVPYEVNRQYRMTEIAGKYYCDVVDIETITITDKFVGFVRYHEGYHLFGSGSYDSHFVAFNTDKPIDKLLEADVYYTKQEYKFTNNSPIIDWIFPDNTTFYKVEEQYAYLKYTDRVELDGNGFGWGDRHYEWDRIQTVEQFIDENTYYKNVYSGGLLNVNMGSEITEEGKAALKGKQWVLRFAETPFSVNTLSMTSHDCLGSIVGDVTILRLKFEFEGDVYNLGVIDNKQTGSSKPINNTWYDAEESPWLWIIIFTIIAGVVIILLAIYCPPVLSFIFKGLWWLICLPFKGIKALIEKIKERK